MIAAAGPTGLRLLLPSGSLVGEVGADHIVTQPTWSRDGLRLAATLTNPVSGGSLVAVVDITTGDVTTSPARRPYFFYSWNHDGTRLAALGPGSTGGTAMDILDHGGMPTSESTLEGGSIFVAWEPGGPRLLLHAGPQLLLISDPDSLEDRDDLGPAGFEFQAAAWVPGTEGFLYVDSYLQPPDDGSADAPREGSSAGTASRLALHSLDSGEVVDLGTVVGLAAIAVHPAGDRAAISLVNLEPTPPTEATEALEASLASQTDDVAAETQPQAEGGNGSVQIVDLNTLERLTVLDRTGFWLEWSPDGRHLLMATTVPDDVSAGLAWNIWDGEESVELTRFSPSVAFLSHYLPFADQYNETPRLWSPDSDAITFGASTAEGDVTAVARLDGTGAITNLGPSDVSFWSPLHVGPSDP